MGRKRQAVVKNKRDPRKQQGALRATVRKKVLAMYDYCAICGRPVDKTLPAHHPMAPEVDEIVPVSRGGSPYDLDNLQLTHAKCNQMKGNKMSGDIDLSKIENPIPNSRAW